MNESIKQQINQRIKMLDILIEYKDTWSGQITDDAAITRRNAHESERGFLVSLLNQLKFDNK